nr:putative mitochondrial protein [Tanacetum cinerariifolium]
MIQASVLKLPNFKEDFVIETDASGGGIRVFLQQGGDHIASYNRSLAPRHQALSTYEKELLVVIQALKKWRDYLLDKHFKIKTDHFSLKYLLDQRITTPLQMKWLPKLMEFEYEILYKKGSENLTGSNRVGRKIDEWSMILEKDEARCKDFCGLLWNLSKE